MGSFSYIESGKVGYVSRRDCLRWVILRRGPELGRLPLFNLNYCYYVMDAQSYSQYDLMLNAALSWTPDWLYRLGGAHE